MQARYVGGMVRAVCTADKHFTRDSCTGSVAVKHAEEHEVLVGILNKM